MQGNEVNDADQQQEVGNEIAELARRDLVSPENISSDLSNNSLSAADPSDFEENPNANLVGDLIEIVDEDEESVPSDESSTTFSSEWSEESATSDIFQVQEIEELRQWAIDINISHEHLDQLLMILRRRVLTDLPKSAKTLLQTSSAQYNIIEMEDGNGDMGEFVYFSLRKGIEKCLDPETYRSNIIELTVNADGVPLTKSGGKELWTLAAKIHFDPDMFKPFPVGIYYGHSKPASADAFLHDFIIEINDLQENGMIISVRHFEVRLKCFICDTPARAFLKGTVGHTARYACERCTVRGRKMDSLTTVYKSTNCEKRTDESFRGMNQREHHHRPSPLLQINPPIDMIFYFVLDFMHLCLLGVMKKLLDWWMNGNLNVRLGYRMKNELSRRLESLKNFVPSEFQRKTRSCKFFAKWKATEFRFLLLYCGPIVLKKVLPSRLYKHFLLFHVACRVLSCDRLCLINVDQAKQLLLIFFKALPGFYGISSQVLNCHHLIHLSTDVRKMACSFSRITAFPFENLLGKMKKNLELL